MNSARISVVGCGWVGLVTALGFAENGHQVEAFDKDSVRIQRLRNRDYPIAEAGVEEAAERADQLSFHTTDTLPSPETEFIFLTLPTPGREDGSADVTCLEECLAWLRNAEFDAPPVLVLRSTVPPGTAEWTERRLAQTMPDAFPVVSNPEFLQEGKALEDFRRPARIVIGASRREIAQRVADLYAFTDSPVVQTDCRTAELTKYASNAFLAMRISFANELAGVAEALGANVKGMLGAVGMDPRVGSRYLNPGIGYGGSCLTKDVAALVEFGGRAGQSMQLARATGAVNERQREQALSLLYDWLDGVSGRRIAIIGMAFKPGTNDLRDAPAVHLALQLHDAGAQLQAWDPSVTQDQLSNVPGIQLTCNLYEAFENADAAVLCTEWPEAMAIDFERVASVMRGKLLIDGRYGWHPEQAEEHSLRVVRIGSREAVGS
ncbi:MAG TPA: UDP-glucose/GDP-mannose dehydrogenase family protein [Dehalococcoidia bacterium]|nr:UDP-glucose/GDP-mannose dehydrogenase family protein [Dehalococcoidia bacterium]